MEATRKAYTTFDIKDKLGIKIDRLKDWMNRGYIAPSVQRASGQGTKNLFSLWDLYMIKLFQYLLERGFSRVEASTRMKKIFTEAPYGPNLTKDNPLYENVVCEDNKKAYIVFFKGTNSKDTTVLGLDNQQIHDLTDTEHDQSHLETCEDVYIVNFRHIMNQVDSAIM